MPLATLIGPTFLLKQGDLVQVAISAENSIGTSDFSAVNEAGARVETMPSIPNPVTRNELTSYLQIVVDWTHLATDEETGGSQILSYQLDWDAGTN